MAVRAPEGLGPVKLSLGTDEVMVVFHLSIQQSQGRQTLFIGDEHGSVEITGWRDELKELAQGILNAVEGRL